MTYRKFQIALEATLAMAFSCPVLAEFTGNVVLIADGDTFTAVDEQRRQNYIHLLGIDAPDLNQPSGEQSRARLAEMVFNRDVTLDCRKNDLYQRKVCAVFVEGFDVGLEQVKAGLAWTSPQYAKDQMPEERESYQAAELQARRGRRGLWAENNPVPPWKWRALTQR